MDDESHVQAADVWDERHLRIATGAAGVALWSWNVDTDRITMDSRAFDLWGLPQKSKVTFEDLSACIHPADLDKVRAEFSATRDLRGPYEIDFRILHGDQERWISARGRGEDEGIVGRIMYGVFLDVTYRRSFEEQRELVAREMHHRIKNLFSLSSALASIAARNTDTKQEMLEDLAQRFQGLSAAHNLIFARSYDQKKAIRLNELLSALLQAYLLDPSAAQNISISAPEVLVGEHAITPLAMIIHELATNATKYGALSSDSGRIVVTGEDETDVVRLVWKEAGGPASDRLASKNGFGNKMTERVIQQFNGSIHRDWTPDGVHITLSLNRALLVG
ncbi:sensor histidine kinase [Pseudotabrizicola formosa]|uniref:sensor histidine kinase n=1 Tax=Pseudotabrizicola formosa TaxID=2030009 RepID=UPI0011AF985B|nr:sensor histidine kinase [Pseudotabrizicola formosa]